MVDLVALTAKNAARWSAAKLTRASAFLPVAKRLVASSAKARYQSVSQKTGVPWAIIAVIHEREASQRWDTQLGQGDPLDRVSVHVPKGRGPFKTWEDGAIDALVNCAPYLARQTDWRIGPALTALEGYNGYGPESHGVASGYIWAGTDQYTKGKYVADGVWDPEHVDTQLGCAGLLITMTQLDPTITFTKTIPTQPLPKPSPPPPPPPPPEPPPKQPMSLIELTIAFIKRVLQMFKGK